MVSMGWTWEYIDEHMTLPRLEALNKYWEAFPPMHILMAGRVGYKQKKPSMKETGPGSIGDLLSDLAAAGIEVTKG